MSSVLLAGAFGQGNPGDEALLSAFKHGLPDWDVVATSDDPARTAYQHDVDAVDRRRVAEVARRASRADGVVLAGGTVFKVLHPTCGRPPGALLRRALALCIGARAFGKPLALVGVGASPMSGRGRRQIARAIVHRSDLLVLRDEESAELLGQAGVPTPMRVGADPSWALFDPPEPRAQGALDRDRVVVALSHLAGGPLLADSLARALAPLAASGLQVVLQPWQAHADGHTDDVQLAHAVAARLHGAHVLPSPADIFAARDALATAGVVVGLRFHSLIAAAAAGVPFVAVTHEPKLAALARRLDQPAVAPARLADGLALAVLVAREAGPPSRAAVCAEIESADETLRLLRVVLSGGRSDESLRVDGLTLAPERWVA